MSFNHKIYTNIFKGSKYVTTCVLDNLPTFEILPEIQLFLLWFLRGYSSFRWSDRFINFSLEMKLTLFNKTRLSANLKKEGVFLTGF